jgi:hypothetical protein
VLFGTASDRMHSYVVISLLTGARTEELRALRWEHVHLDGLPDARPPVPPYIEVWRSVREGGDTKDVKASDGLSNLEVPVLNLAVSLRTPQNVAVVQFFSDLGSAIELTIITVVVVTIMVVRRSSRTHWC